ncbi:MAG: hypothetical protein QG663_828 [Thermodesulfobacteriota bacterium]|nr:hypothetical protein [Thermodesulfobacteriota bacterium]
MVFLWAYQTWWSRKKVVTPVKTGVQHDVDYMILLDSGFRRNDEKGHSLTFNECIKLDYPITLQKIDGFRNS